MNVKRIGWILLAVAGAAIVVFILCGFVFYWEENADLWRVFSVCMPVAGVCFMGAAVAALFDFIRKR